MVGIKSYGAYIPYYRMPRTVINQAWGRGGGRGEKAVAGFDEDTVTMSVAAGLDCLKGIDPKSIDAMFMATTTAPSVERQNAGIVASALDFRRDVRSCDFSNSLRAGTGALLSALDAVKAGAARNVLITASDMRPAAMASTDEQDFGDGAAAFLLGSDDVAVEIEGSYTLTDDFIDSWRGQGDQFVRSWEDRFIREEGYLKIPTAAAKGVMKRHKLAPQDFSKVCYYGYNAKDHASLGAKMGFKPEQIQNSLLDTVGNTGAALPLMVLVTALEEAKAGDRFLLVSYGNGSEAIILRATENIAKLKKRAIKGHLEIKKVMTSYTRYLRWRGLARLQSGFRVEEPVSISSIWRERATALPLYGFKCRKCGNPQIYNSEQSTRGHVCMFCFAKDDFDPYKFADKPAKVVSFSHDYLAGGVDPPNTTTIIDFEGGGRGSFLMVDRDPDEVKVGMGVEMTFRKISNHFGVSNYYWKCKPARS